MWSSGRELGLCDLKSAGDWQRASIDATARSKLWFGVAIAFKFNRTLYFIVPFSASSKAAASDTLDFHDNIARTHKQPTTQSSIFWVPIDFSGSKLAFGGLCKRHPSPSAVYYEWVLGRTPRVILKPEDEAPPTCITSTPAEFLIPRFLVPSSRWTTDEDGVCVHKLSPNWHSFRFHNEWKPSKERQPRVRSLEFTAAIQQRESRGSEHPLFTRLFASLPRARAGLARISPTWSRCICLNVSLCLDSPSACTHTTQRRHRVVTGGSGSTQDGATASSKGCDGAIAFAFRGSIRCCSDSSCHDLRIQKEEAPFGLVSIFQKLFTMYFKAFVVLLN